MTGVREAASLARRSAGFGLSALVLAVSPLVSIPAITATYGAGGWTAYAVGQSFGGALAVVVGFGWPLAGPVRVARATRDDPEEVGRLIMSAVSGQLAVLLALAVPVGALAAVAADSFRWTAAVTTFAAGLAGVVPTWLFVGRSAPGRGLLFAALPSLIGAVAGSLLLLAGAPLVALPLSIAAVLAAAILTTVIVESPGRLARQPLTRVLEDLRQQAALAGTQLASLAYINLPVGIVALSGAAGLTEFAAGDRIYRLALAALLPVTQVFQGWVPAVSGAAMRERMRASVVAHAGAGLVGGLGVALLSRPIGTLLFRDTIAVPWSVCLLYGAVVMTVMLSRAVGLTVLIPLDRSRRVLASAVAGSALTVLALAPAAIAFHAPGAVAVILVVELAVLGVQVSGARGATARVREDLRPGG